MTPKTLKVAVLGLGGVGGFLAAMLAREGNSVLALAGDDAVPVTRRLVDDLKSRNGQPARTGSET